jgi:hypothetical protein
MIIVEIQAQRLRSDASSRITMIIVTHGTVSSLETRFYEESICIHILLNKSSAAVHSPHASHHSLRENMSGRKASSIKILHLDTERATT